MPLNRSKLLIMNLCFNNCNNRKLGDRQKQRSAISIRPATLGYARGQEGCRNSKHVIGRKWQLSASLAPRQVEMRSENFNDVLPTRWNDKREKRMKRAR